MTPSLLILESRMARTLDLTAAGNVEDMTSNLK
jgi:hypothetical protein